MPIEIKELIIRAVVDGDPVPRPPDGPPAGRGEREALIQACVDETLRILRRRRER